MLRPYRDKIFLINLRARFRVYAFKPAQICLTYCQMKEELRVRCDYYFDSPSFYNRDLKSPYPTYYKGKLIELYPISKMPGEQDKAISGETRPMPVKLYLWDFGS